MPAKKTTKKATKAAPKKSAKAGSRVKTKTSAKKEKKGDVLKCGICGYRVIVDEACGCVEEHALICCGKPMKKARAKKAPAKKAKAKKK